MFLTSKLKVSKKFSTQEENLFRSLNVILIEKQIKQGRHTIIITQKLSFTQTKTNLMMLWDCEKNTKQKYTKNVYFGYFQFSSSLYIILYYSIDLS